MKKKWDSEHARAVAAGQAGLSFSEHVDLLGFSCITL